MSLDPAEKLFTATYGRASAAIAAAPGRIEFIGNHTDYNGGAVLGAAIDRRIHVAVDRGEAGQIRLRTADQDSLVSVPRQPLKPRKGAESWVNYPLGVLAELERAGMPALPGIDMAVASDLPLGAGLSSSAALELATAAALLELSGHRMPLVEMVRACRRAENHFVGVPCGILDQGVSGHGRRDHLVHIDCAAEVFSTVPLPAGLHFWIFNTNEQHSLVDSLYSERHQECTEARERLAQSLGRPLEHLVELAPAEFEAQVEGLPDKLAKRARHVLEEHNRVAATVRALEAGDLKKVGALLAASHWSSSRLFENSTAALDRLVEITSAIPEVYGSRLTGGGFGGAIMALTSADFSSAQADAVVEQFCREQPRAARPSVFHVQAGDGVRVLKP